MLPFEMNQPLERYRLRAGLDIAAFAATLDISEEIYVRLVTGAVDIPVAITAQIARRLSVSPWLINECAPALTEAQRAAINASLADAREHGWIVVDLETLEPTGEIVFDEEDERPAAPVPEEHLLRAQALYQLERVHRGGADPDYPRLRGLIEAHIRTMLGREADLSFNVRAWAWAVLEIPGETDDQAGEQR